MAKEVPDVDLLDEFVRQHPQYADVLTNFAVELVVESRRVFEAKAPVVPVELSPAVSRAMSKFHNALYGVKSRATTTAADRVNRATVDNPIAKYQRTEFRQFVKDLQANPIFACRLRDGLIDAATMTRGFIEHLARAMKEPVESVAEFLDSLTPTVPAGQFCKADDKPQAGGRQTFEEAVKSSSLTEEQQRFLLSL
jgi:hypothetical protein